MGTVGKMMTLEPIYGWGWVGTPPDPTRETPVSFTLAASTEGPGRWAGVVQTPGHEFDGLEATLSQRHPEWDGCVNVTIGPSETPVTAGWATLVDHQLFEGTAQDG
jgi:hypothetical protein